MPSDLLTTAEVAEALRVTPATVTAYIRDGELKAVTLPRGRGYRIHRSELDAFLVPGQTDEIAS